MNTSNKDSSIEAHRGTTDKKLSHWDPNRPKDLPEKQEKTLTGKLNHAWDGGLSEMLEPKARSGSSSKKSEPKKVWGRPTDDESPDNFDNHHNKRIETGLPKAVFLGRCFSISEDLKILEQGETANAVLRDRDQIRQDKRHGGAGTSEGDSKSTWEEAIDHADDAYSE